MSRCIDLSPRGVRCERNAGHTGYHGAGEGYALHWWWPAEPVEKLFPDPLLSRTEALRFLALLAYCEKRESRNTLAFLRGWLKGAAGLPVTTLTKDPTP